MRTTKAVIAIFWWSRSTIAMPTLITINALGMVARNTTKRLSIKW